MNNQLEETSGGVGVSEATVSPTYRTDFICTYNRMDDDEDSLILYQLQILQAFDLLEFNDTIINKITTELYEKYKDNQYIINVINNPNIIKSKTDNFYDNLDTFRLYFRYDTFYLFHSMLCCLVNNTEINKEDYEKLLNNSTF